jgi:hypothetical protein
MQRMDYWKEDGRFGFDPFLEQMKAHIKKLLENESLPMAAPWLTKNSTCNELGGLVLTFSYDEEAETLRTVEHSTLSPRLAK